MKLQENSSILYDLCGYPLFLLSNKLDILVAPANYPILPMDFFNNYQEQIEHIIQTKRNLYMLYEQNYFYSIIPLNNEEQQYLWIGPIFLNEIKPNELVNCSFFNQFSTANRQIFDLKKIAYLQENYLAFIQFIYLNYLNQEISEDLFYDSFRQKIRPNNSERFQTIKSRKRELATLSYSYPLEVKLLKCIQNGDAINARILAVELSKGRLGQLSTHKENIALYAFISMTSLVSRTVMNCGVDIESAYGLNDLYIQKAEEAKTYKQLNELWYEMIVDFCLLVNDKSKINYPIWINQCHDFIMRHLHQPISLSMISEEVHMQSAYVSVQFKKITGISLTNYIQNKKIEEAQFLLQSTNTPILDISTMLAFASQAYFSTIFKKVTGLSPSEYRLNIQK